MLTLLGKSVFVAVISEIAWDCLRELQMQPHNMEAEGDVTQTGRGDVKK
jgi:hypothetical protein